MRKKGNTVLAGLIICLLLVFLAAAGKLFGAYGIIVSVAPNMVKIGFKKIAVPIIITAPIQTLLYNAVLATLLAASLSPRPKSLDK